MVLTGPQTRVPAWLPSPVQKPKKADGQPKTPCDNARVARARAWTQEVDAAPVHRAPGATPNSVVSGVPRGVAVPAKSWDCQSIGHATSWAYTVAALGTTVAFGVTRSRNA